MAAQHTEWRMHNNYDFEEYYDIVWWMKWLDENWKIYSFTIITAYLVLVYLGRKWMESRTAYKLRGALLAWNVALGAFSIFASWRETPVMINALYYDGWHMSICSNKYFQPRFRGIWGLIFTLSKIPELGDTLFIVLRKQKLMFLHWYHHSSVILFVFYEYGGMASLAFWFSFMNFPVHSLMYPYYAIRAAGIRPPKWVPMIVTSAQIVQMMIGTYLVCYGLVVKLMGGECDITDGRLAYAALMYITYGSLFANFFYHTYLKKRPTKKSKDKVEEKNGNDVILGSTRLEQDATKISANSNGGHFRKREATSN